MTPIAVSDLAAATPGRVYGPQTSDPLVSDLTHNSAEVSPGTAFACVVGANSDGHDFAGAAVDAGAPCLVVQRELDIDVAQIVVADVRAALGAAAAAVHGYPSRQVATIGVTGTAGKTSVTHAVADVLHAAGRRCSVLGTLHGSRTTPEATDLQRWLAERAAAGDDHVAIEVSSHALDLGRVNAVEFAVGVFTNLSPEHLDFHGTMDNYFNAKRRLFDGRSRQAVVNRDDAYGQRLLADIGGAIPVHSYGLADLGDIELAIAGSRFRWREHMVSTRLVGRFNLINLAAAATTAVAVGLDERVIADALATVAPIRGRMEPVVVAGSDISVLVDYSHKPDALRAALESAREYTGADLWVVFGAGGDRDRAKRPLMGEVAQELADHCVVTSDNPRSESPVAIIEEIVAVMSRPVIEADRDRAIGMAIEAAGPGDVVVIAGKGHETTQTIGADVFDFDDVAVSRRHLRTRIHARGLAK